MPKVCLEYGHLYQAGLHHHKKKTEYIFFVSTQDLKRTVKVVLPKPLFDK